MHAVVGPVLTREGGFAFDCWTPEAGFSRGFSYRCVEDAHYARKSEIRARRRKSGSVMLDCSTLDEFASALAVQTIPAGLRQTA